MDAADEVKTFIGPFYPKLYDSTLVLTQREYFENNFKDATIIADNHFHQANSYLKNVTVKTRYSNKETLPDYAKRYNKEHKYLRSRVERPYSVVSKKFESLKNPWMDGDMFEQKKVTKFAIAVHNKENKE